MIIGDLKHLEKYSRLSSHMRKATDYLKADTWRHLADGCHELGGESFFILVSHYLTKEAKPLIYEAHKRYIDIQIVLSGEEGMGFAEYEGLENTMPYDTQRDISFWSSPKGDDTIIPLFAGRIALLFPDDAHAPGLSLAGQPCAMHKVVVKVLWED